MARVIAAKGKSAKEAADRKLGELAQKWLREDKSVDLVREFIRPVCDTLFETLLGVPLQPGRRHLRLSDLRSLPESEPTQEDRREGWRDAQDLYDGARPPEYRTRLRHRSKDLGLRFPRGFARGSILHVLKNAPGERLCDIAYPQTLPQTGVPYVERFAAADCRLGDADIKKATAFVFILIPGPSRTMPTLANAISGEAGTPASVRTFPPGCGAR